MLNLDYLDNYKEFLIAEEKSVATIEKYIRDVKTFIEYAKNERICKEVVIKYKSKLISDKYAVRSINSMLASLNNFFKFLNCTDCCVKSLKVQNEAFRSEDKELTKAEYIKLVKVAYSINNKRLALILQTICSTGIRISELKYFTVESIKSGRITVNCKSKIRDIFIVKELRCKLLKYAKDSGIVSGAIFITKKGNTLDRISVWREMKKLCKIAEINPSKVFPHNLRHLFARLFYNLEKDIVKLADILGHSSINTTRLYMISTGAEHCKKLELMKLII